LSVYNSMGRAAKKSSAQRFPQIAFQPEASLRLQRGINQIADLIRPTLGPFPRLVAISSVELNKGPEVLDNGAVIARRIVELGDRASDPGAMLLRHALWQVYETVGDGTATTAVLYQFVFKEGLRYLASGGSAMHLRRALEDIQEIVVDTLRAQTVAIKGQRQLTRLARTLCYDEPMAVLLGEIFDIIGEYGPLEIRPGNRRAMDREDFEGAYWDGGLFSRLLINRAAESRSVLENAAIVISDLKFDDAEQFRPLLELAVAHKVPALVILAGQVSDNALALFTTQRNQEVLPTILIKVSSVSGDARQDILEDIAMLTGGRPFVSAAGGSLGMVKYDDLGHARQVWANLKDYGIIGGQGDPRRLREHIAKLRTRLEGEKDPSARTRLQQRTGRLMGGSATLYVGADSQPQMEARRDIARRASEAMRSALRTGIVAGGGIALLNCQAQLQRQLTMHTEPDERAAYDIVRRALEEPFRTLLTNAGYDPAVYIGRFDRPGTGVDVQTGKVVDMVEAGIVDPAGVVQSAVQVALSGAAQALTIDVLVHHRKREESLEP